jgi:1,4-alpha-glucan branching enzyme
MAGSSGRVPIDGIRYDEVRVIENNGRRDAWHLTETVRATIRRRSDRGTGTRTSFRGAGAAGWSRLRCRVGDGLRDVARLLAQAAGGASAPLDFSAVVARVTCGLPDAWRAVQFLENQDLTYAGHGTARIAMLADASDRRSWCARSRSRVVTSLLLAAPGIPSLFMGEVPRG